MSKAIYQRFREQIEELKQQGLYKEERVLRSPQGAHVKESRQIVLNLCANNYLDLASHSQLVEEGKEALDLYGFGMASVRFICGTHQIHQKLEDKISHFLGKEDTILYSSCFDANTGLFETLLGPEDAIISDQLNHASIIDGIRLCKAKRFRYKNNDMADLEKKLQEASSSTHKMICTDGVFSMDGTLAKLPEICRLAKKYDALTMVDDSHAIGFIGKHGRGTPEHFGVEDQIDIVTGTLGKALGGASGGYTSGKKEVIEWLRQRSRPYLFSNSLTPMIASVSYHVFDELEKSQGRRERLHQNTQYFRRKINEMGYQTKGDSHPIVPIMIGHAVQAKTLASELLKEKIYVISFSYPVVPQNEARIRVQMSAGFQQSDLDRAVDAFYKVGKKLKLLKD